MTIDHFDGLVPDHLKPRTWRAVFEDLEVLADIGFHDFEVGSPQRLLVSLEVWLDEAYFATDDEVSSAWNYDNVREEILRLTRVRRYNLQETLVRSIYQPVAARAGVKGLKVSSRKPDVYPDCRQVGVELSSF